MLKPPFLSVGKVTLTITRKTAGTLDDNGRYVEGSSTTFTTEANVQPGLKFNDTQFLPEGERGRLALRVYCYDNLRARKEGSAGYDADRFVWTDGRTYVVRWSHQYRMGVLNHCKAIAVAEEVT